MFAFVEDRHHLFVTSNGHRAQFVARIRNRTHRPFKAYDIHRDKHRALIVKLVDRFDAARIFDEHHGALILLDSDTGQFAGAEFEAIGKASVQVHLRRIVQLRISCIELIGKGVAHYRVRGLAIRLYAPTRKAAVRVVDHSREHRFFSRCDKVAFGLPVVTKEQRILRGHVEHQVETDVLRDNAEGKRLRHFIEISVEIIFRGISTRSRCPHQRTFTHQEPGRIRLEMTHRENFVIESRRNLEAILAHHIGKCRVRHFLHNGQGTLLQAVRHKCVRRNGRLRIPHGVKNRIDVFEELHLVFFKGVLIELG